MTDKEFQMIQDKKAKRRLLKQRLSDTAFEARVLLPVLHRMTQAAEDADCDTITIPTGHGWTILSVLQFVCALHEDQNT
jgi:hypothetical protein